MTISIIEVKINGRRVCRYRRSRGTRPELLK
jgi:hypothetical protein